MALSSRVMNGSKKRDFLIFLDSISIFYDPYKDKGAFPIPHPNCSHPTSHLLQCISKKNLAPSCLCLPRQHQDLPTPSLTSEQIQLTQLLPVCHTLPFPNHLGNLLLNSVLMCFLTGEPQNGEDTPGALLDGVKQTDSAIGSPKFNISNKPLASG